MAGPKAKIHCTGCGGKLKPAPLRSKNRRGKCDPCARVYEAEYARRWRRQNPIAWEAQKDARRAKTQRLHNEPPFFVDYLHCRGCNDFLIWDVNFNPTSKKTGWFCRPCLNAKNAEWFDRDKAQNRLKQSAYRWLWRAECYEAYGGKCACCGEDRWEFLTIDHTNGGGAAERKRLGSSGAGPMFCLRLRKRGYPKDEYRLLCMNCNMVRGFRGYCPHEAGSKSFEDTFGHTLEELLPGKS